jgi:hypothetical protein
MNLLEEKIFMFDVILVVEDKNDVFFLKAFILKNYINFKENKIKECQYSLENDNINLLIRDTKPESEKSGTGGWSKLQNLIGSGFFEDERYIKASTDFVILFDADEDKSDNIIKKNKDIEKWLLNKQFVIHRFYWPFNNNKSHNLEQLLELSINKPFKWSWKIFIAFFKFTKHAIEPKSKKGKIIIYKDIYLKLKNNKNEYLSEMWNLDTSTNKHLKPLKEFLDPYLT